MAQRRNRLYYAIITAIVIVAGCASRSHLAEVWPNFVAEYAGDTLWALMIFLGIGFIFPSLRTSIIAAVVLAFAYGVEFSQLYRAPWIEAFRETFIGAVAIGSGFLWSDFICYTVGCGIGVIGEMAAASLQSHGEEATLRRTGAGATHRRSWWSGPPK